ncbi:MAG: hypothetical protein AAF639_13910 [Chloroflexota bacterium]
MKIFLATSFYNQSTFAKERKWLTDQGHEVFDWTQLLPIRPYPEHAELTEEYAITLLDEIVDADIFVLLVSEKCRSSYIELGAAMHARMVHGSPDIYVIGNYESMYFLHPSVKLADSLSEILAQYELPVQVLEPAL